MKEHIIEDPTIIVVNSIPSTPRITTIKPLHSLTIRIKPNTGDGIISINIQHSAHIVNYTNNQTLSTLTTSKSFSFNDAYDTPTTHHAIHNFILHAMREFNNIWLSEGAKIGLTTVPFAEPSFLQTEPYIIKAFMINNVN